MPNRSAARLTVRAVVAALLLGGVGPASLTPGLALGAPEPSPIPQRWQLDVRCGPLRLATVDVPGRGPRSYYYLTYLVTNNSGEDLLFAPSFDLANDEGRVVRSGLGVPPEVTREILARLDNPLLLDQVQIIGQLLQGRANAKEGLVVWPAEDLNSDELTVYAAGFSGESRTLKVTDRRTGQPAEIVLRKTYMLRYQTPGENRDQRDRSFAVSEEAWIMR